MKNIVYPLLSLSILLNVTISQGAPVTATIDGITVTGFKGWLKNGIFSLYTGQDATWEYGQKVSFWHIPTDAGGKYIEIPSKVGTFQPGQMTYDNKNPKVKISTVWLKDFKYTLSFGKEKDFKIPVTINGEATKPHKIKIKGSIEAATAGIKMSNGVIDSSFDHLDTITWLLKNWIKKHYKVKEFFKNVDICMMENSPKKKPKKPRRQVAACSTLFSDQAGKIRISKLWFEKISGNWKAIKALKSNQLLYAHPIKPPFAEKPPYIFKQTAAKKFEDEIYTRQGGYKRIKEPSSWTCGGGQKAGQLGYCEGKYKVYAKNRTGNSSQSFKCEAITYIFRKIKWESGFNQKH